MATILISKHKEEFLLMLCFLILCYSRKLNANKITRIGDDGFKGLMSLNRL